MNSYILIAIALIGLMLIEIIGIHMQKRIAEKAEKNRIRYLQTELLPEIRDMMTEVIAEAMIEANEESMRDIPEKLKNIRNEMEREE